MSKPRKMSIPETQPSGIGKPTRLSRSSAVEDPSYDEELRAKSAYARKYSHFPKQSMTIECISLQNRKCTFDESFYDFNFAMRHLPIPETASAILFIFKQLEFDKKYCIPQSVLNKFIICARQGYRELPYHNWMHACSVTHFSYLLIRNLNLVGNGYINDLQAFSLIVSSLTHDIDHRGTNNQFEVCSESCLYQLYREYDTSIMERHHLDFTLSILNRDDCNLMEFMSDKDKKEFRKLLSHNILATDISKHISNRDNLFRSINGFNKTNKEFRFSLLSCCMTISDLCDSTKTWDDNLPIVNSIFAEFFTQGDEERNMGWKPATMLDRNHAYIPDIEIKFLNFIVRPVYTAMAKHFPPLNTCVENINKLCELWLLSTEVFNKYDSNYDPLEILQMHELQEDDLMLKSTPVLLEKLKNTDFSQMRAKSLESEHSLKSFVIADQTNKPSKWCCCIPRRRRKKKYTIPISSSNSMKLS